MMAGFSRDWRTQPIRKAGWFAPGGALQTLQPSISKGLQRDRANDSSGVALLEAVSTYSSQKKAVWELQRVIPMTRPSFDRFHDRTRPSIVPANYMLVCGLKGIHYGGRIRSASPIKSIKRTLTFLLLIVCSAFSEHPSGVARAFGRRRLSVRQEIRMRVSVINRTGSDIPRVLIPPFAGFDYPIERIRILQ